MLNPNTKSLAAFRTPESDVIPATPSSRKLSDESDEVEAVNMQAGRRTRASSLTMDSAWHATMFNREKIEYSVRKFTKKVGKISTVAGTLHRYDPSVTEGLRACCIYRGTVFERVCKTGSLLVEIGFYVLAFFLSLAVGYFDGKHNYAQTIDLIGMENIRTLTTWVLTTYITLELARWWRLRTDGIGAMWAGSSNLAIMIGAHFRKSGGQDLEIRRTIKRYCRAAMAMLFLRYQQEHFSWEDINLRGTLTSKEIGILRDQGSYAEAVWSWIASYLADLYNAKLLPPVVYQNCLDQVAKGRGGAGAIAAQMGCQLPLTYVHVVNLLVKFNNVWVAVLQGYKLSQNIFHPQTMDERSEGYRVWYSANDPSILEADKLHLIWIKYLWWLLSSLGSVILMTTLYNAMLIVAQQLSNPFNQDRLSFPGLYYEKGVEEDGSYFHEMAKRRPWNPQTFLSPIDEEEEQSNSSENEGPVHASLASLISRMSRDGKFKE